MPAPYISSALEIGGVIHSSAAWLKSLSGRIDQSAPSDDYFLLLIDDSVEPENGAVTRIAGSSKFVHVQGSDTLIDLPIPAKEIHGDTGLVWMLSTTEFELTKAGAYAAVTATCENG
ncbi:MAG: hypothetical protein WCV84_04655 [Patescibacteria group bacterium]